jgi:hypothetical protein
MDSDDIIVTIRSAITKKDPSEIDFGVQLLFDSVYNAVDATRYTDILNKLLVTPHHQRHQEIARTLQDIKAPSSIPFVENALASHFDYLSYTCSESGAIAKWFSWLLFEIGTPEAMAVIQKYAHDTDEGIRREMQYRLSK